MRVLEWVQRTRGLRGKVGIKWQDVNLQDAVERARAELTEAQAQKTRTENALRGWANGWWDQSGAKAEAGYTNETLAVQMETPVMGGGGKDQATGPQLDTLSQQALASRAMSQWQRYP